MEIYKKINEHKMMTNNDLINIINDRLKQLNLYKKNKNLLFLDEKDLYFRFDNYNNKIHISKKYKKQTLYPILDEKFVKTKKKTEKSTFFS